MCHTQPLEPDVGDPEPRRRDHGLKEPAERAGPGPYLLRQVGPGAAERRVARRAVHPALRDRSRLRPPEVMDQVAQPQHPARTQHPGDPVEGHGLPEDREPVERVPGEHGVGGPPGVLAAGESGPDRLDAAQPGPGAFIHVPGFGHAPSVYEARPWPPSVFRARG